MPRSHPEGRDWTVDRIAATTTPIVFDVGCGEGTYSDLARGWRADAIWIGVEVWEPYVDQFDLWRKYDVVVTKDLRELILPQAPFVLLAGDVIEHMPRFDAVDFLQHAKDRGAQHIMVSVPIIDYPQHHHDNPFEDHLDQWSFADMWDVLKPGGVLHAWRGEVLGRFWWTRSS